MAAAEFETRWFPMLLNASMMGGQGGQASISFEILWERLRQPVDKSNCQSQSKSCLL